MSFDLSLLLQKSQSRLDQVKVANPITIPLNLLNQDHINLSNNLKTLDEYTSLQLKNTSLQISSTSNLINQTTLNQLDFINKMRDKQIENELLQVEKLSLFYRDRVRDVCSAVFDGVEMLKKSVLQGSDAEKVSDSIDSIQPVTGSAIQNIQSKETTEIIKTEKIPHLETPITLQHENQTTPTLQQHLNDSSTTSIQIPDQENQSLSGLLSLVKNISIRGRDILVERNVGFCIHV